MSNEPVRSSSYDVGYRVGQTIGRQDGRKEERARLRTLVQAAYDHVGQQGAPGSDPFDAGRLIALRQVLDIIDREAPSHD